MPPPLSRAESTLQKEKLINSYNELLKEFGSKDLRNVGNYALGRLIGKGSFGKVYLATHKLTNGSKVVLKSSDRDDPNLAREIHHHRQFLHPHITRLYEVIVTEKLVWLALEYCPGDELYNHLLQNGPMEIEKVQKIFTQLVGAVAYVHSKSCVHRDLKLENILLDKHGNVKLCDFGFTREYEGKASYLQTFCGTICYSAPEMLRAEKYAGEKVDVWSLGIILYALVSGELPFDEDDDQVTKTKILSEEPKYSERFTDDAKSLTSQLLSKRPLLRPTLSDILAHPFLSEFAPQQQANLKLTRPPTFSTHLEKTTLERMRSAGVNVDQVKENVLAQRCDALAGWWALLIEKEERKEKRRERKRREKEAEAKNLRRLSTASNRISAALVEVDEDNHGELPIDRGRKERRSIPAPQLQIPDLPKLPESYGYTASPDSVLGPTLPPPPVEKDSSKNPSIRSSGSFRARPMPPPKERRISRGSTLHVSTSQPELARPQGILRRQGTRRHQYPIISHFAQLKHWLIESAKRAKSPHQRVLTRNPTSKSAADRTNLQKRRGDGPHKNQATATTPTNPTFTQNQRTPAAANRSSNGSSLAASRTGATRPSSINQAPRASNRNSTSRNRNSLSPIPSRNSYRRSSVGLRGRKSTSSSISSIRTIHHGHSHSKASSISSNSIDTVSTPVTSSMKTIGVGRSPHSSVKVLPTTPNASSRFPSNIRIVRGPTTNLSSAFNEAAPSALISSPAAGPIYARRKRSAFKGPGAQLFATGGPGAGSLARQRGNGEGTGEVLMAGARKSQIIEEEEDEMTVDDSFDDDIEEVDTFSSTDEMGAAYLGERHSIDAISPTDATQAAVVIENETTAAVSADLSAVAEDKGPTTPGLAPAAEITEADYSPYQAPQDKGDSDQEVILPPRSSSLQDLILDSGSPKSKHSKEEDKGESSPIINRNLPPVITGEPSSPGKQSVTS